MASRELFGEDSITAYDEESYVLKHIVFIDCAKNWFLAALYLAAITFDAAAKEKVAILATLLMMLSSSANLIAPPDGVDRALPVARGHHGQPGLLPDLRHADRPAPLGVLFASPSTKRRSPPRRSADVGTRIVNSGEAQPPSHQKEEATPCRARPPHGRRRATVRRLRFGTHAGGERLGHALSRASSRASRARG